MRLAWPGGALPWCLLGITKNSSFTIFPLPSLSPSLGAASSCGDNEHRMGSLNAPQHPWRLATWVCDLLSMEVIV